LTYGRAVVCNAPYRGVDLREFQKSWARGPRAGRIGSSGSTCWTPSNPACRRSRSSRRWQSAG